MYNNPYEYFGYKFSFLISLKISELFINSRENSRDQILDSRDNTNDSRLAIVFYEN